jgi:hypothetical protein
MIKVKCTTNLDKGRSRNWPIELPEVPLVGDLIECTSGDLVLKVISRTWIGLTPGFDDDYGLKIELGLPPWCKSPNDL